MSFSTTFLISSIKRRASIPTSQNLFSNADFLALANEELQDNLVPLILSAKEEYFVFNYDYSIQSGLNAYAIPSQAIGGSLRDVQLIENTSVISLCRLFEEDRYDTADNGRGFFIQGNNINISPTPTSTSGTLRLVYYRRPNALVLSSACGQIESIDTGTNQIVVSSVPSAFTTGVEIDFIKDKAGFDSLAVDQSISGVSGTTISFASLPTGLAVGDWIALAGESPVPQIPQEAHSILAQMVTVKCLEAMNDAKAMQLAEQKLQMMKDNFLTVISPRITGENKKVRPNGLARHFLGR